MIKKSILNNKIFEKISKEIPMSVLMPSNLIIKKKSLKIKTFTSVNTRISSFKHLSILPFLNFPSSFIFFNDIKSLINYSDLNKNITMFHAVNFFIKSSNKKCIYKFNYFYLLNSLVILLQRNLLLLRLLNFSS